MGRLAPTNRPKAASPPGRREPKRRAMPALMEMGRGVLVMVRSHAEVSLQQRDDVVTLVLQGDFDLTTAPQLREALLNAYRLEPVKLVISLHEVTFLDAVTVGILAAAQAKFCTVDCQVVIQGSTPTQSRVLELAGLAPLLEFIRIPRTRAAE